MGLRHVWLEALNLRNDEDKSYEILLDKNIGDQDQCFELLRTHTESREKPNLELKLSRYEFLDEELNLPIIVNVELGKPETE